MRYSRMTAVVGAFLATSCDGTVQNTDQTPGVEATQALQPLDNCKPCHLRQYDETLQSLMTGYRSVSPLMNALELAGNYGLNGLLRPRYGQPSVADDRPSGTKKLLSIIDATANTLTTLRNAAD